MPSLAPSCCRDRLQNVRLTIIRLAIFVAPSWSKGGNDLAVSGRSSARMFLFSNRNGADIVILLGESTNFNANTLIGLFWSLCVPVAANSGSQLRDPHFSGQYQECNIINKFTGYFNAIDAALWSANALGALARRRAV